MKKQLGLFLILLSVYSVGKSQDKKGYIGISFGTSIPTGDFASKDIDNEAAGFATYGASFEISLAHKVGNSNFGFCALLRGQFNPTDANALVQELATQHPNAIWHIESDGWGIGGIMFGGFGQFTLTEKINFQTRLMLGFLNATSPEILINGSAPPGTLGSGNSSESAWFKQSSAVANSPALLLGVGYTYDLGEKFYILFNVDYLAAKPEFSQVEISDSYGNLTRNTWKQTYGSVNITGGIALKI